MRNAKLYLVFVLLFGVAVVAYVGGVTPQSAWNALFSQGYKYAEAQEGVLFASNEAKPSELLPLLAQGQSFILSPMMTVGNSALNGYASQGLIQQQIVLAGHRKITTTVIQTYDASHPSSTWQGCQTDFGTAKDNEFVSVEECTTLLRAQNSIVIETLFPNPSLFRPTVEISSNKIVIKPVSAGDIPGVNFLVMRALFSDAEELIQLTNDQVASSQENP